MKKNAVLLLSGGLDSAVNLALSFAENSPVAISLALTVDYGQKSVLREIESAEQLARHYGVESLCVDFHTFGKLIGLGSSLIGAGDIPTPESLDELKVTQRTAKSVWVPNRNGLLISLAAAVAESRGLNAVVVGFNAEEAVTFPDNTVEYMKVMTNSLSYSTQNHVEVMGLTSTMTKVEMIRAVSRLSFPFEYLWSCYRSDTTHCGSCESCQRLKRAIKNGIEDSFRRDEVLKKVFG